MSFSFFKLRKCKAILKHSLRTFRKRKNRLSSFQIEELKTQMNKLQENILSQNAQDAVEEAHHLESLMKKHLKKNLFDHSKELVSALTFALIVAVVIRQMWFEFYEIPSGSMRPTLKEKDKLIVSKTQFGINIPLTTSHLLFDDAEVQRGGIVIFTGKNMDIPDAKTRYFYLFPGIKQYIKRMIGLPGDTLYFYGGKVYGVDKEGNDISSAYQSKQFETLEHIPFMHLEGKTVIPKSDMKGIFSPVLVHQMNQPIAKLYATSKTEFSKKLLVTPKNGTTAENYDIYDLWGMGNYASTRILTQEQLFDLYQPLPMNYKRAKFYLELTHHANLKNAKIQDDLLGRKRPVLGSYTSIIPLEDQHIQKIWENLYSARFSMKNGYARRYDINDYYPESYHSFFPKLRGYIPDGTYEFQNGKAYEVKWQGITKPLPSSHPLMQFDPERFYLLFNIGIELDIRYLPQYFSQPLSPSRYAYFRDGDLYVMGAPVITKDDPTLKEYVITEEKRVSAMNGNYIPFVDYGAPLNSDGSLDTTFIKTFGITIPEGQYLVLGDNHAMSGDSRDFGFVPKENIRGVPSFIFWASGSRFGYPNQLAYSIFTTPRMIVWMMAIIALTLWTLTMRKRYQFPIDFDKE